MASYTTLKPNKQGIPGIKIIVEHGYDEETGERIRFTKTIRMKNLSDRAINKAITEFEIEVANRDKIEKLERISFKDFCKQWMDMYVRLDLTVKSRNTYESYLKNGILDYFDSMKMQSIKTFHIVNFFAEQKKNNQKGLPGKYMCLKSIFAQATLWGVIKENPMQGIKRPTNEKRYKDIDFYDEDQLKHLLEITKEMYPKHALQIKLAALCGLRLTEIVGIRIECLNFNDNTILIDSTLQYDKETSRFFLGPTKTKKSRIINVPAPLMKELKEHSIKQQKLKLKSGPAWNPMLDENKQPINLLFTKNDGFPTHPDGMSGRWRDIVKRHNLPKLTFHGLRHTYASYMISKNVNFKIIQEQLGHASIKETLNTYSHLTQKDRKKASDLFDQIL